MQINTTNNQLLKIGEVTKEIVKSFCYLVSYMETKRCWSEKTIATNFKEFMKAPSSSY